MGPPSKVECLGSPRGEDSRCETDMSYHCIRDGHKAPSGRSRGPSKVYGVHIVYMPFGVTGSIGRSSYEFPVSELASGVASTSQTRITSAQSLDRPAPVMSPYSFRPAGCVFEQKRLQHRTKLYIG